MKTWRLGLALLAAFSLPAAAATQEPSVAEAARRAREQKKQAPKAVREWTNDNLPTGPPLNVLGPGVAPTGEGAEGAAVPKPARAAGSAEEQERADVEAELATLKQKLANVQRELELLSREHDLQRQQLYGDPGNALGNRAGQARFDALGAQVQAKRQEVQELQQQIAAVEDQLKTLDQALGPKPEEPLTPEQEREAWVAKLRPLREELARVEGEINRMRAEAAARGQSLYGTTTSGSFTGNLLEQLERRRRELQGQIAGLEDEARRAGVPSGWLR